MRKQFLILVLLLSIGFGSNNSFGQNVLDGLYANEHVANRKPISYPYVREADVLWAKKVWRIVDLREKINLPLYYPTTPRDDRFSLISLLLYGIQNEGLTAYSAKSEDEFEMPLSLDEALEAMGAGVDSTDVLNPVTNVFERKRVVQEPKTDEVKQVLVKEIWFFDRNYSRLDVRILGICPIREFVREGGDGAQGEVLKQQAFWIYFPEARDLLARHEVFNPANDAQRRSFDDIFIKRYFDSYIVQEANVYDNRSIDQYTVGKQAILESQRIKEEILNWEHDVWEF
jgi:gliding motility associated protien GldN